MSDRGDISALLGSRICHDLISPLGAIGNGIELLTMTMPVGLPEIALLTESVESANARIRFFRIAYGAASEGQSVAGGEIRSILSDMGKGGKVIVDWKATGDVPRPIAKTAFLALQCAESALPWGGEVTVGETGGDWRLTAAGNRMRVDERLWSHLAAATLSDAEISASDVQFALLPQAAQQARRALRVTPGENRIELFF